MVFKGRSGQDSVNNVRGPRAVFICLVPGPGVTGTGGYGPRCARAWQESDKGGVVAEFRTGSFAYERCLQESFAASRSSPSAQQGLSCRTTENKRI